MQDGKLIVQLEWEPPADCGGAPVASYEVGDMRRMRRMRRSILVRRSSVMAP